MMKFIGHRLAEAENNTQLQTNRQTDRQIQ